MVKEIGAALIVLAQDLQRIVWLFTHKIVSEQNVYDMQRNWSGYLLNYILGNLE